MIDQAAADKPDIIVLPETFIGSGNSQAETVPGPTTDFLAKKARKYNCYLTAPMLEETKQGLRNAVILLDRKGNVCWKYYKYVPTINEMERDVIPGESISVYETDFGRIGAVICFDLNFHEIIKQYKKNRAELIIFPSMFRGGFQFRIWAYICQCYMVSATPGENSLIVNPLGRILAESSSFGRIIFNKINLDFSVVHIDCNHSKVMAMKRKYKTRVELDIASPEAVMLLTSHHKKSIKEMIDEFDIETCDDYFNRARTMRKKILERHKKQTRGK
jgi:predicted amidohydrolase